MKHATTVVMSCVALLCCFSNGQSVKVNAPKNEGETVFRIGKFDRSSIEFAAGNPKGPVSFTVGQSVDSKDWYQTQPAVLSSGKDSASADAASGARTIVFSVTQSASTYNLRISFLIESASVPVVRVGINGKYGLFYLHPELDYSNGDQVDSFYPASSQADIVVPVPNGYLQQGQNTITLQAVEEADQKVPDAGLTYDAIELDRGTAVQASPRTQAIWPTVFYQRRDGALLETVDAFIPYGKPLKEGATAKLTLDGKSYERPLSGDRDFGEEKLEFQVAEFRPKANAQLSWNTDGHPRHLEQSLDPKKKWTLFLVPHIHVDVGYSDYQAKVAAIQARSIDEAMAMTEKHPDYRFSVDGEWDLEQFLRTHNEAQQQRALGEIQKEHLYVPAQYANLLTGFPTGEVLIRSLYPSANFSRIHQTPFNYANLTDVPSYSWSYASILASAGIHDLAGGSNNYRAPVLLQGRLNEASPMWWQGPDGAKVLLWYSRIYQQMQMLFGLPPLISAGHDTLPLFLQMYEKPGYLADSTILYGTQVENTDLFPQQAELAEKWNAVYAYPHLQYSGFREALDNIQKQFGNSIPTIRGDGGPYWEDGIASDAYYAGIERWNEGRAPSAEKLASLSSLVNPLLVPDKQSLDQMWKNIVLMDEHTWDSYNSTTDPGTLEATGQLAVKEQYAVNARAIADFVVRNNMESIVNTIPAGTGSLILFNSLNWKRSGTVSVDLDKGVEIVDTSTGQPVPSKVVSKGDNYEHVQFQAEEVPPMGYKVFFVRPASNTPKTNWATVGTVLENTYYKVDLDSSTGAVRSIYDKQLQRELVDQLSPYKFGQYLYVSGGSTAPNSVLQYSHVYPKPDLSIHPAQGGTIVSVEQTPYGSVAYLKSTATNTPTISTEIRLYDKEKKIEFIEDLDKTSELKREAAYFVFPFAVDQPQFQYEIQTGVVDPEKDMYPGAGHEWFSVQHWVSVQHNGVSGTVMPLDASLVTLGDINRGEWPERFEKRPGTVFSYIMNNYWDTNYRAAQGGHFQFHYLVTSAPSTDASSLSRMGWEEITPLEVDTVTSQDKALPPSAQNPQDGGLDGKEQSFAEVSDPTVLLETWKAAEDGNGSILRFLDLGGAERTVDVQIPLMEMKSVSRTDSVERNQGPLTMKGPHGFSFTIHHNEIVTVRILGSANSQKPGF